MSNELEKDIELVIDALFRGIEEEDELKYRDEIKESFDKHGDMLLDPDKFKVLFTFKKSGLGRVMAKTILTTLQLRENTKFTREQAYLLEDVYLNYGLYEAQVRRLIEKYEGHGCCADKSRFLLKCYVHQIKTGELPDFGERTDYWIPGLGSPESWMEVLSQSRFLNSGQVDGYIEARSVLVSELELGEERRLMENDTACLSHPLFVKKETEQIQKDAYDVYTFQGEEDGKTYEIEILVGKYNGYGYRSYHIKNGERERLSYSDKSPTWMKEVLAIVR